MANYDDGGEDGEDDRGRSGNNSGNSVQCLAQSGRLSSRIFARCL